MKNLIPYQGNCFEIHKLAVEKKRREDLKIRLRILHPAVEVEYTNFIDKFETNNLSLLEPNVDLIPHKVDLLTLYWYQSSVVISIRESIKKLQVRTIISTCQNCTIDSANSFDHVLPSSVFPEFIVNPKNLFPCCTKCNSYKEAALIEDANQKFLNLYLDELPEVEYLFVDVFLDEFHEINFRFYLENIAGRIPSELYSIIENHYRKLHLFERMRLTAIEYIDEFQNIIKAFRRKLPIEDIIETLIGAATEDKKAYGQNHWRCIIEIQLLKTPIFMDKLSRVEV